MLLCHLYRATIVTGYRCIRQLHALLEKHFMPLFCVPVKGLSKQTNVCSLAYPSPYKSSVSIFFKKNTFYAFPNKALCPFLLPGFFLEISYNWICVQSQDLLCLNKAGAACSCCGLWKAFFLVLHLPLSTTLLPQPRSSVSAP